MKKILPFFLFFIVISGFFYPFIFQNKLPIPSDTIIGLYHPFRDSYSKDYPRGVPFKNFLITDPVRQQYPFRFLAIEIEKRLTLPLWNPYNMGGVPLLAGMQSGSFYPLNILLFIFPFSIGWSILVISQPLLSGIFMYLYLNNLKLRKIASFLGAITFAFCGFATAWLEWGTVIHTALWLPLVLLSIDKILHSIVSLESSKFKVQSSKLQFKNKKLIIWSLIFVISLTSSFFAGHLQTFFYLFVVSSVYFFASWIKFGKQKKLLFLFLILNSFLFILTAIQWLSTLQLILKSARNIDQNWLKEGWFIPWQNLVQFVAPDFFGNPTTLNYWGIWNYAEFVGYVGIMPLIMTIFALCFRNDKKTLFFTFLFLVSLIFSLPTFLAKIPYLLRIPFFSSAQPTRLLFIAGFALSVLAALGFDFFIKSYKKKQVIYPLLIIGIIFAGLWIFVLNVNNLFLFVSFENMSVAKNNLYFPTGMFVIISILLTSSIFIENKRIKQGLILLLIGFTLIDLFRFANKFTPFTDQKYLFPQTSAISYLQNQKGTHRIMTNDDRILPPNFSTVYRLQSVDGYDPLYLRRYGELIAASERGVANISPPFGFNRIITPHNYNSEIVNYLKAQKGAFRIMTTDRRILAPNFSIMYHLQAIDGYEPLYLLRYGELMAAITRNKPDINPPFGFNRIITQHEVNSRLIDLLGVKFVLSLSDLKLPKLDKVFTEKQTRIYENKNAFPRAFFVTNVRSAINKNEAINLMFDSKINFANTAIVENWDKQKTNFIKGAASFVEHKPERVIISTKNSDEAFLVLMDTFYPTWHVRICSTDATNCHETKIYLTNYNFRGIIIPKGNHKIFFENYLL